MLHGSALPPEVVSTCRFHSYTTGIVIGSSSPDKGGDRNGVSKQLIFSMPHPCSGRLGEGKSLGTPAGVELREATLHPRLAEPTTTPSTHSEPQRPLPATCSTSRVGWLCLGPRSPRLSGWKGATAAKNGTKDKSPGPPRASEHAAAPAHRGSSEMLDPGGTGSSHLLLARSKRPKAPSAILTSQTPRGLWKL